MNKFCIIANREKDSDMEITTQIIDLLKAKSCEVNIASESSGVQAYTDVESIPDYTECAIVLGGDGTIIHAAHDLIKRNIPILGINLGTLGFLAEIETQHMERAFEQLLCGNYILEERMMISAKFLCTEYENQELPALNDVVITRSGFSRIIRVGIYVNGFLVQDFRGDGVIISTPTGSTGYNLSAGGPIIAPLAEMIVITPICPHSLHARSIVVSSTDIVEVEILESKKTQQEEAIVTVDGDMAVNLSAKDRLVISKAKSKTGLIRFEQRSFFDVLRSKLGAENKL